MLVPQGGLVNKGFNPDANWVLTLDSLPLPVDEQLGTYPTNDRINSDQARLWQAIRFEMVIPSVGYELFRFRNIFGP